MVSEVGNEEGGQLDHSQKCQIWSLYDPYFQSAITQI